MAGPYCRFCGHRCFVVRTLPDRTWSGLMATCAEGAAHDREELGRDHTSSINPVTTHRMTTHLAVTAGVSQERAAFVMADLLRLLAVSPIPAEMLELYAHYLIVPEESHDHAEGAVAQSGQPLPGGPASPG